jgi:hypothetical protein
MGSQLGKQRENRGNRDITIFNRGVSNSNSGC